MSNTPCVLITGTSRGLGAALAQSYIDAGNWVVGCSRGPASITHPHYLHFILDVADELAVIKMFNMIREQKLMPHLLVNNAAISQKSLATTTSAHMAKQILDVNLLGAFLISREAVKLMQRNGSGRIVNLTSINVPLASVGSALYNATKAGLEVLGRSLSSECKSYDITVNSIGLSIVANTGMADDLDDKALASKRVPLMKPKHLVTSEIVAAINFFASAETRNITGQQLYFGGVK